jgi:hypothetical protein
MLQRTVLLDWRVCKIVGTRSEGQAWPVLPSEQSADDAAVEHFVIGVYCEGFCKLFRAIKQNTCYVRVEIVTAVIIKHVVFWDLAPGGYC